MCVCSYCTSKCVCTPIAGCSCLANEKWPLTSQRESILNEFAELEETELLALFVSVFPSLFLNLHLQSFPNGIVSKVQKVLCVLRRWSVTFSCATLSPFHLLSSWTNSLFLSFPFSSFSIPRQSLLLVHTAVSLHLSLGCLQQKLHSGWRVTSCKCPFCWAPHYLKHLLLKYLLRPGKERLMLHYAVAKLEYKLILMLYSRRHLL